MIFPNTQLPNHRGQIQPLSHYNRPSTMDRQMGFTTSYPLIVVFFRGYFCPRDYQQMQTLVSWQAEREAAFIRLVAVSVDPPAVNAAYRAGLGARWPFLSDVNRELVTQLGILDETEGEHPRVARPMTYVLRPDFLIHNEYDGWFYVGRPTIEELRQDVWAIMEERPNYAYVTWNTPQMKEIRVPAETWQGEVPPLEEAEQGIVNQFHHDEGWGMISTGSGESVFFHFTAIPGSGYRTIEPGTHVRFAAVVGPAGRVAQRVEPT